MLQTILKLEICRVSVLYLYLVVSECRSDVNSRCGEYIGLVCILYGLSYIVCAEYELQVSIDTSTTISTFQQPSCHEVCMMSP